MSTLSVSAYTMETVLPDGQVVLFNTLSQSICVLDRETWAGISVTNDYPTRQAEQLLSRGFLVENSLDETAVLAHWRLTQVHDLNHLTYYIHIGSQPAIHLRHPKHQTGLSGGMTRQTVRQVLEFMITDIETRRPLSVEATFGGLDCLSQSATLNHLAEALYLFCRGKNIEFKIHLLADETALQGDRILYLKRYGLHRLRIVPRGFELNDDASFSGKLMSQIMAFCGIIGLDLEIGYDPRSQWQPGISALLDRLSGRGMQSAIKGVRIFPTFPNHHPALPAFHPFPDCACRGHSANELFLEGELIRRGFAHPEGPPRRRCPARYRSTIMIEPDGRISSCPWLSHRPDLDPGHVSQGIDIRKESLIKFQTIPSRCRRCRVLPLCDGGCLGMIHGSPPYTTSKKCLNPEFIPVVQSYVTRQANPI